MSFLTLVSDRDVSYYLQQFLLRTVCKYCKSNCERRMVWKKKTWILSRKSKQVQRKSSLSLTQTSGKVGYSLRVWKWITYCNCLLLFSCLGIWRESSVILQQQHREICTVKKNREILQTSGCVTPSGLTSCSRSPDYTQISHIPTFLPETQQRDSLKPTLESVFLTDSLFRSIVP